MNRREFITLVGGAAAWPTVARAQQSVRQRHVGVLMTGSPDTGLAWLQALKARLAELGWVDGKTVAIDEVWADGRLDRFPTLAAHVRQRPDVIVAPTTTAVLAIKHIAPDIPTVFLTVADPVSSGLIASHAHPGGSATGIQGNIETLPGKQIELLREIVPAANRIAILVNIPNPSTILQKRNAEAAAVSLGLTLLPISISSGEEIETAFDQMRREGVQAVIFPTDATVTAERRRIARLAMEERLPSIFPYREQARDGGLLSYGFDLADNYRRAADFVHKILSGAKAADLPVEFPTRLYLGINLKTAKALGLTIPESFLLRADEVIE